MITLPHPKHGQVTDLELERQYRREQAKIERVAPIYQHPSVFSAWKAVGNAQVQIMLAGVHVGLVWYALLTGWGDD